MKYALRPASEAGLVEAIWQALTLKGYLVQRCQQRDTSRSGSDVIADMHISRTSWPRSCWLWLEVKTAEGKIGTRRPAYQNGTYGYSQRDLVDMGRMQVVRSLDDALSAIAHFEASLCK